MMTIVVFFSSLFVVSLLIFIKAIELKYGKKNLLLRLINRLDGISYKILVIVKFKILQFIQSIRYIILIKARDVVKNLFNKIQEKIMNEYKIKQEIIMGRRDIVDKGSASFYLKKITENKGNNEKGKIEDSL